MCICSPRKGSARVHARVDLCRQRVDAALDAARQNDCWAGSSSALNHAFNISEFQADRLSACCVQTVCLLRLTPNFFEGFHTKCPLPRLLWLRSSSSLPHTSVHTCSASPHHPNTLDKYPRLEIEPQICFIPDGKSAAFCSLFRMKHSDEGCTFI